ncbi:PspA/IM30 family protein [Paenibacillus caui]|uniref:PspA/IM30 family protein n=1 Tax=Paenibacillus caui TaxID=2873927 RepID=UPI001CA978DC|nr:PspA/IM30 family protein [Paenibacillus caui]
MCPLRNLNLTRARINALMDKAEDPLQIINQYIREMELLLEAAEQTAAKQLAALSQFRLLSEEQSELAKRREEQAYMAVQAGQLDLARRALLAKSNAEKKAAKYKANEDLCMRAADYMYERHEEIRLQLAELISRRDALIKV